MLVRRVPRYWICELTKREPVVAFNKNVEILDDKTIWIKHLVYSNSSHPNIIAVKIFVFNILQDLAARGNPTNFHTCNNLEEISSRDHSAGSITKSLSFNNLPPSCLDSIFCAGKNMANRTNSNEINTLTIDAGKIQNGTHPPSGRSTAKRPDAVSSGFESSNQPRPLAHAFSRLEAYDSPLTHELRRNPGGLLRWSRGTRRRHSLPRKRAARTQCAARAHACCRRALLPLRRKESDQSADARIDRGIERRTRAARAEAAGLLGKSQLASDARRHVAPDEERRHQEGARIRHVSLQFVLRVPPISRGYRARPSRSWRRCSAGRQAPRLLQSPRISRRDRRPPDRSAGADSLQRASKRPGRLRRAQHSPLDGEHVRLRAAT